MKTKPYGPTITSPPPHSISPYYDVVRDGVITEIVIKRSDRDPRYWPGEAMRTQVVGADRFVDFYDEPEEKNVKHWKKMLGFYLAKFVLQPLGYDIDINNCYIRSFPQGYKLFCHKKGHKDAPRRDSYLCGWKKDFRSPAEFARHLKWLMLGAKRNPATLKTTCDCCYCDDRMTRQQIAELEWGRKFSRRLKKGKVKGGESECISEKEGGPSKY
ncbi:hypothetical protein JAAARDRAFT_70509 [Jaapia argillacea MUCL 33604]|uniref:Cryptic loci regulator 2 N-terminal domain-containing protein n=1 Tax=Jaapia argillacea MUCL 33604 TaxID=933084 RepID=A0A067Q013_9AGAM|nr:hypothetical protein JAAARDRAFT_70509 [Jaapia argillacea MUCL 33604]